MFKNLLIWKNTGTHYGFNIQGNDNGSRISFVTSGYNGLSGIRLDPYPHHPITNAIIINNFSLDNNSYGFLYQSSQVTVFRNNSGIDNGGGDLEPLYAPDISSRLLDPVMVAGHERGATIVNRYLDGEQTSTPLWPWPDEGIIKEQMCNIDDLNEIHRWNTSDNLFVGRPEWCEGDETLTEYIWQSNGASCPEDICNRKKQVAFPAIYHLLLLSE